MPFPPENIKNVQQVEHPNIDEELKLAERLIDAISIHKDQPAIHARHHDAGVAVLAEASEGFAGEFHGTVYIHGDIKITGNAEVGGDVTLSGADYAEALTTTDPSVEAGHVVVLGYDGEVHPCDHDYDTAVAGIVSGAGGVKPAIVLDRHDDSAYIAMIGKVWCLADADVAPISPGDLLTTSSTPGHCRKVTDPSRAFGAVIGKALTGLTDGRALVRVLVSPR